MALRGTAGATGINSAGGSPVVVTVTGIGIQNGDLVLLCMLCVFSQTPVLPSGFTSLISTPINGSNQNFVLAYKVASSEPSSYSIASSGGSTFGGAVQCRVYSGRSGVFTFSTVTVDSFAAFPITANATGGTAAAADDIVVFYGFSSSGIDNMGWTLPSGFGNGLITQDTVDSQVNPIWAADNVGVTGGATGTITATLTNSGADTNGHHSALVASMAQGAAGGAVLMGQACL